MTLAPETPSPCAFTILPFNEPVVTCADADTASANTAKRDKTSLVKDIFINWTPEQNQKLSLGDDRQVKEKTGRRAHDAPARKGLIWSIAQWRPWRSEEHT